MDARGARLDHRLHQLVRVERAAEAGLGVGDDRREPVRLVDPLRRVDLVGAQERVVQPPHQRRDAVGGVEALVGIGVAGEVRLGRDLPTREIDRVEPGAHHLHRLPARDRAESRQRASPRAGAARGARRRGGPACARPGTGPGAQPRRPPSTAGGFPASARPWTSSSSSVIVGFSLLVVMAFTRLDPKQVYWRTIATEYERSRIHVCRLFGCNRVR